MVQLVKIGCYGFKKELLFFPFQNINNFDYDCFYESVKPSVSEINSESYLDLYSVKFNKNNVLVLFL